MILSIGLRNRGPGVNLLAMVNRNSPVWIWYSLSEERPLELVVLRSQEMVAAHFSLLYPVTILSVAFGLTLVRLAFPLGETSFTKLTSPFTVKLPVMKRFSCQTAVYA